MAADALYQGRSMIINFEPSGFKVQAHLEYSSRIESADKIARLLSGEGLDGTNGGTDTPEMTQNAT